MRSKPVVSFIYHYTYAIYWKSQQIELYNNRHSLACESESWLSLLKIMWIDWHFADLDWLQLGWQLLGSFVPSTG